MREYGLVFSRFWINPEIQSLTVDGKLLALYLLTCTHANMLGCYRLPTGYIAEDLQWSFERVKKGFKELIHIQFLSRDEETGWLFIHNYLNWNPIENPNQGKSIIKLFHYIPDQSTVYKHVIEALLKHGKHLEEAFLNRLETLLQPFLNQEQDQEQEQEQEQDTSAEQPHNGNAHSTLPKTIYPTVFKQAQEEYVITIPLNDQSEFPITQSQITEWQSLYPAIDVLQTLRNIRGWNLANTKKRKTKNGILKHVTTWLAKEQDSYHANNKSSPHFNSASLHVYNEAISKEWLQQTANVIDITAEGKDHDAH